MKYLSTEQVAERYGVKVTTVRDWARKGLIPAHKIGRIYRFTLDDLAKFDASNAV